tara:strand:+ start:169 stop:357 length:189 start_codon:yes stop_codon:yes gene_type:complete
MSRLVLTRKTGEEVIVHDYGGIITTIKITKVEGNQVRLSFEANEEVYIDRKEIFEKKQSKDS